MSIIEKFHQDRVGLRYYENPIALHVWKYRPFAEPIPDPPVYEYMLHYGAHGETSEQKFDTEEIACEAAVARATELLAITLKALEV